MGIVHKLLKQRDLERQKFMMDLTKSKLTLAQCESVNDVDLVPRLATDDNQFTAEHIVQLCRFLAEKSTRNKTQTPKRLTASPNSRSRHEHKNQRESVHRKEIETPAPVPPQVLQNFSTNSNAGSGQRSLPPNVMEKCHFSNTQEKRDILLKIRQQIFERKRQRQVDFQEQQQQDVWRPW